MSTNTHNTYRALINLGVSYDDAVTLRRISMTLHRWNELECGDEHGNCIERDDESGKPFMTYERDAGPRGRYQVADRERGAQRRLAAIIARYPALMAYEQGDPRGCALYIVDRASLGDRDVHSCYSSFGVAVMP